MTPWITTRFGLYGYRLNPVAWGTWRWVLYYAKASLTPVETVARAHRARAPPVPRSRVAETICNSAGNN